MNRACRKILPAFSLAEVLIVLIVIGIIAVMAVPLYVSAASAQLKTAADIITFDLEYARSMAISTGRKHSVVFDTSAESYCIKDSSGQVIAHPVKSGAEYAVSFAGDSRLDKVDIVNTNLGAADTVSFDNLGAPFDGDGAVLNNGFIQLRADNHTLRVKIQSVTGYVSVE